MWPFSKKKHRLLVVSLSPQHLVCSVLEKSNKKDFQCALLAYERTSLKRLEFAQAIPFNTTSLKNMITRFIKKHQLQNIESALSVSGPRVLEKIITVTNAHPEKKDFNLPELKTAQWESLYLCPSQKNGFDFFVCAMEPYHLFSYKLLAQQCGMHLTTLTTAKLAHLYLYKYLHAQQFRQAKLSLDLLQQRYDVHTLCPEKDVIDAVEFHLKTPIDAKREALFLKSSLGLFLAERS